MSNQARDPSAIFDAFLASVTARGLSLYPAQEEAILAIFEGANVVLNTPTGSGKSLVAQALHALSIETGRVSYYTSPIKALVNEKFLALCRDFGPEKVGMITGDATVNADAPIICCTAEILSNLALREGDRANVHDVVMDEFHYYSDRERGVAWQVPLLALPQCRFLLMSATLGDTTFFEEAMTRLNGRPTVLVKSIDRPVPLETSYAETPLHETIQGLVERNRVPVYVVNFTQRECAEVAQSLTSVDFCSKDEKRAIAEAIGRERFDSPYGKDVARYLRHGIGLHHGGLLPKYRVLVERLAQRGLLKIIVGTDTLGVGVNIPIRTVLFTKLCKYDGTKTGILSVRDFRQISGRAGRKGFDDHGYVVVQAPDHVVENLRMDEKARENPGKAKKMVKRKPPEKGFVNWDRGTFERLQTAAPEALHSQFTVDHGMLLSVLSRQTEDGCRSMAKLIRDSHETPANKKKLRLRAFELFRSLVDRKIVEFAVTSGYRKRVVLNLDLQQDFSLNQALSLFLIDALALLDRDDPAYALNVLSLVESILEEPDIILRKQVDRLKTAAIAEMKADGVEYDERMERLEKIEHPKPLREFIYTTYNEFAAKHPWVGADNIRPKSVAREMYEGFHSFADYVREYELQRGEGILLRYISETYRVLAQTVPESDRNDEVVEMIHFFRAILQTTDASLIEEWERLGGGGGPGTQAVPAPALPDREKPFELLVQDRAFRVPMRNTVFRVLRALAAGDLEAAAAIVPFTIGTTELAAKLEAFHAEHGRIDLSPDARNPKYLSLRDEGGVMVVENVVLDGEGATNWVLRFQLDRAASAAARAPVLSLVSFATP